MGIFGRKKPVPTQPVGEVNDESPGWDSIDAACSAAYPGVEPVHFDPGVPVSLGGTLDGISAFPTSAGWHFVTYGLTELNLKDSEDAERSGWGYELTLLTPPSEEPPGWALKVLLGLASSTWQEGRTHDIGDRIALGEPIDGTNSDLTGFAVAADPALAPSDYPFGQYAFHRLVGVTDAEREAMQRDGTAVVLASMANSNPTLVTAPDRRSSL